MSTLLSDGNVFESEREFWCYICGDWRDVTEMLGDIVCDDCHGIIASFRDRDINAREAYRAGYLAALTAVLPAAPVARQDGA